MTEETEIEVGAEEAPPPPVRDDDDAAYSERVKKRIGQEVGKRRTAEQAAAAARAELAQERNARIALEQEMAKRELAQAREATKQAYADGDPDKQVAAAEALAAAAQRQAVAQSTKPVEVPQTTTYTSRTQQWIDDHPWYEADPDAKAIANRAHGSALAHGLVGDSDAYWEFIEAKVAAKFPHHFEDQERDEPPPPPPKRDIAPVAPARRAAITATGQKMTRLPSLSAAERDMAKVLNMTEQEYAAGKLAKGNE